MMISSSQKSWAKYLCILILLLAFAIRLWDLDARSLWFDEAFEYWSAQAPLGSLPQTVTTALQPPLYTLVLHLWLKISIGPFWLRFLAVGLDLLALAGTMALAYRVGGGTAAAVAGTLMALLPAEVRYAQEVAEYALMGCLLAWSLYYLHASIEAPTWRNLGLWGLLSVLSVYSHYGAAITIFAAALVVIVRDALRKRWQVLLRRLGVSAGCLVLMLPLFLYFLPHQISWQRKSIPVPPAGILAEIKQVVLGLGDTLSFLITGWPFSSVPKVLVWIPIWTILVLALFVLAFRSKRVVIVTAWFWVSFLVYYLFVRSGFYGYGQFGFRYGLILVPLFVVLIALTVAEPLHPSKWPAHVPRALVHAFGVLDIVAALAIIGLSVYSLPNRTLSQATRPGFAWPETQDVREVVQYWMANKESQDPTYVYYGAVPAFRYYVRVEGVEADRPLPPAWQVDCWGDSTPEYCSSGNVYYGQWFRGLSPSEKRASMAETFGEMPPRFWLVFSHVSPEEDAILLDMLDHDYVIADSKRFVGASIYLLDER